MMCHIIWQGSNDDAADDDAAAAAAAAAADDDDDDDACMRWCTGSALVQLMANCLFSSKSC